jgi:N6-adenosine-specific RNA methylase IME4
MMMEEANKLNPSPVKETNQNLLEQNGGIKRNIIYADPPWEYTIKHHEKGTTMNGLANQHYSTMSLKELKQLNVQDIASKDCILFLWTTGPQMKNSIELMNEWGFQYKTMFMTWIKTTKGEIKADRLGFYTRQSCEYVLMGSRGNVLKYKNPDYTTPICNVFEEDSQEHSRKPIYVRELIDKMFLNVPKIELFAREQTNVVEWDYWGNEVDKYTKNTQKDDSTNKDSARRRQIQLSDKLASLKRTNEHLVDSANKYGVERNHHTTLTQFLQQ